MTSNPQFLSHITPIPRRFVTLGGGPNGVIFATGIQNVLNLLSIPNVSLVDGLQANLISIRQPCDDQLGVQFT